MRNCLDKYLYKKVCCGVVWCLKCFFKLSQLKLIVQSDKGTMHDYDKREAIKKYLTMSYVTSNEGV